MTKRDRIVQVYKWLCNEYPCAYPVRLLYKDFDDILDGGDTERIGKQFLIQINRRIPLQYLIEILIHEWAHAFTWKHEAHERREIDAHTPEWGLKYAEIYRHFYDDHGFEESREL